MINSLIEMLKYGCKQSGDVYDGFYEADFYNDKQTFTIKAEFRTKYQPGEIELSDEMGREKAIEATQTIILTSIVECYCHDEDGTILNLNENQEKLIIELIEIEL